MPFGVKANVRAPHKFLRMGALCWVELANPGWGGERIDVRAMSRGGRIVRTWVDARDLTNYRPGWCSGEDHRFHRSDRESAQAWCDDMNTRFAADPLRPAVIDRPNASHI